MSTHAEKCPVCEGSGEYNGKPCHGCDGKGWVSVSDEKEKEFVPYPVYPYQPPMVTPTPQNPLYPWVTYCDNVTTTNKLVLKML